MYDRGVRVAPMEVSNSNDDGQQQSISKFSLPPLRITDGEVTTSVVGTPSAAGITTKHLAAVNNNDNARDVSKAQVSPWTAPLVLAVIINVIVISTVFTILSSELWGFLLFHCAVEIFCVCVGFTCLVLTISSAQFVDHYMFQVIGMLYASVALLDFVHTMSFPGMTVLRNIDPLNISTQTWVSARFLEAVGLLVVPFFITKQADRTAISKENRRRSKRWVLFTGFCFFFYTFLVLLSIFWWENFPDTLTTEGLTNFKKGIEYVVIVLSVMALGNFYWWRSEIKRLSFLWIVLTVFFTCLAEVAFSLYETPTSGLNRTGHAFKVVSYSFLMVSCIDGVFFSPVTYLLKSRASRNLQLTNLLTKLNRTREELAQALQVTSTARFRALMSHTIRTPLHVISGATECLLTAPDIPEHHRDLVTDIQVSGERLLDALNDVLQLSELDGGVGATPKKEPVLLMKLLGEVHTRHAPMFRDVNIELVISTPPNVEISSSRPRLLDVMHRCLDNALKYTHNFLVQHGTGHEKPIVTIETFVDLRTDSVSFEICDTGPGLTEEQFQAAQHTYMQASQSLNQSHIGSGLGIPLSRKLMESIGGSMEVTNRTPPDHGLTVRLNLLKAEVRRVQVFSDILPKTEDKHVVTSHWSSSNPSMPDGISPFLMHKISAPSPVARTEAFDERKGQFNILICDDIELNRKVLRRMLEVVALDMSAKFFYTECSNGEEAVQHYREHMEADVPFSLVFMDLMMPVMGGVSATKIIHADWNNRPAPIVALTAAANTLLPGDNVLFDRILTKPLKANLLRKVLACYGQKGQQNSLKEASR